MPTENRSSNTEQMVPAAPGALAESVADVEVWLADDSDPGSVSITQRESIDFVLYELKRLRALPAAQHQGVLLGWVHGEGQEFTACPDHAQDLRADGIELTPAYSRDQRQGEPSAPVEIDERAEFEAAWSLRRNELKIKERGDEFYRVQPNDLYRWPDVQAAWEMWQARAALEHKP